MELDAEDGARGGAGDPHDHVHVEIKHARIEKQNQLRVRLQAQLPDLNANRTKSIAINSKATGIGEINKLW